MIVFLCTVGWQVWWLRSKILTHVIKVVMKEGVQMLCATEKQARNEIVVKHKGTVLLADGVTLHIKTMMERNGQTLAGRLGEAWES